ncbi:MAG: MBL fold metallo-hydrolase [Nitrospinae bacterium]|nr:MBL fold metallo-hydrolase [Nitrospinota bacterium]
MTKFFEIDFLEAGERSSGDAIALRYREDNDVDYIHVIDGGYTNDGDKLVEHICTYYDAPSTIDHVVLTHPDGDHSAGLKKVLEEFEIGALWMNRPWKHIQTLLPRFNYDYTESGLVRRLKQDFPHMAELEEIAEERGIKIEDAFQGNQIGEFTVLAPSFNRYIDLIVESDKTPEPQREAARSGKLFERVTIFIKSIVAAWGEESLKGETEGTSRENETSVVQFAELCGEKILLTGDAGIGSLDEAYYYAGLLGIQLPGIDRFDVPHHGSRRNLSSDLLDKWIGPKLPRESSSPSYTAIISANQNDKEHPRKAVVRALIHRGAKAIQTAGTIRTHCNGPDRGWSAVTPLKYPEDMEE